MVEIRREAGTEVSSIREVFVCIDYYLSSDYIIESSLNLSKSSSMMRTVIELKLYSA